MTYQPAAVPTVPAGRQARRVPVDWLLAAFGPAYGDSWDEAMAALRADPVEAATVAALEAALRSGLAFDQPVQVDPTDRRVANGMHRVTAAVSAGAESIDITDSTPTRPADEVEVTFRRAGKPLALSEDEASDQLLAVLRSFPTPSGWAEAEIVGCCDGVYYAAYRWPAAEAGQLVDAVCARAARWGHQLTGLAAGPAD